MRSLVSRLKRLERVERKLIRPRVVVQQGRIKQLPPDYKGERHVVVVSCAADENGRDFYEWEECPGPGPPTADNKRDDELVIRVVSVPCANNKLDSEMDEDGPRKDLIAGGA